MQFASDKKTQDKLIIKIQAGDEMSKRIIVSKMKEIVRSVASKYNWSDVSQYNLIICGNRGLERAINLYNPSSKFKFSTYATWFIRAEIHKKLGLPTDLEGLSKDKN